MHLETIFGPGAGLPDPSDRIRPKKGIKKAKKPKNFTS